MSKRKFTFLHKDLVRTAQRNGCGWILKNQLITAVMAKQSLFVVTLYGTRKKMQSLCKMQPFSMFNLTVQFDSKSLTIHWIKTRVFLFAVSDTAYLLAGPNGRAVQVVGLRPLACWNDEFESRWGHKCHSLVSVVCCQVDVSASGWSLVQRVSTERDAPNWAWS